MAPKSPHIRARCAACNVTCEQRRRTVRDVAGVARPALECLECETLCLLEEHTPASERITALEAKVDLYSATLRQRDDQVRELEQQLAEAESAKQALSAQLLMTERRAESKRPPPPPPDEAGT